MSESKLLNVPGLRALRAELLGSAMTFYEEFLKERATDPTLTTDLLRTRLKVARVLEELGQGEKARDAYVTAAAGFEQALRERPDDADLEGRAGRGALRVRPAGKADEFVARYRRAIALREEVLKARPGDLVNKRELAEVYNTLYFHLSGSNTQTKDVFGRSR